MKILKTITCFALRLALYMPLAALAYFFDGMRMLFERLSDGFFDMASATRQMTMAPYIGDIATAIEKASQRDMKIMMDTLK